MDSAQPPQTPEGQLIERAAAADRRKTSQLAAQAGISDQRWRHIVKGYQSIGSGRFNAVRAPAATLARMAAAVGLRAEDLLSVGRADAAAILPDVVVAKVRAQAESATATGTASDATVVTRDGRPADEIDMIYRSRTMSPEEKLAAIRMVLHLRAQADAEQAASGATDEAARTRPEEKQNS